MFGELRQLLHGEQGWTQWWSICALLDALADPADPRYEPGALDYASQMAARWPDTLRISHDEASGAPRPHLALTRSAGWYRDDDPQLRRAWWAQLPPITTLHSDCAGALLDEPVLAGRLGAVRDLTLYEGSAEEALALLERHQPALGALQLRWLRLHAPEMERLLKLDHIGALRVLELDLSFDEDAPDYEDEEFPSSEADGWADEAAPPSLDAIVALGRCARLTALDSLDIGGGHQILDLEALAQAWQPRAPTALLLSLCTLPAGAIGVLERWLPGLRKLGLGHTSYDAAELTALLRRRDALPRLQELSISGRRDDLRPLLRALDGRPLRLLDMAFDPLGEAHQLGTLAQTSVRHTLAELRAGASNLGPASLMALCEHPWASLTDLSIWGNPVGEDGARELGRAGALAALTKLYAPECQLGDAGLGHLARGLSALTTLRVGKNHITDRGVEALLSSPMASRLLALDLEENREISAASVAELLDPARTPALLHLGVSRTAAADDPALAAIIQRARQARPWLYITAEPGEGG